MEPNVKLASMGLALWALLMCLVPTVVADDADVDIQKRKADLVLKLQINRAIDKGAAWVATQQERDGAFHLEANPQGGIWPGARHTFGETALGLYTLAHCGDTPEDKHIKKALSFLKKRWRKQMEGDFHPQASAYSLCLLVMALHELYAEPGARSAGEREDKYGNVRIKKGNPCGFPDWARRMTKDILDWLVASQAEKGLFRYPGEINGPRGPGRGGGGPPPAGPLVPGFARRGPDFYGPEDLSNSQYVLLALWVGTRCGYELEPDRMHRVAQRLIGWQAPAGAKVVRGLDPEDRKQTKNEERYGKPDDERIYQDHARGFGYTPGDPATGSMTAAGLSSLVTIKAMLDEHDALTADVRKALDKGIWDAIAWLQVNYSVRENPPLGHAWHYYYLYGLERALVIADKRLIGENDWYRDGARLLVGEQADNGQWSPTELFAGQGRMPGAPSPPAYSMSLCDTCFALLFLKRAAFKPKRPVLPDPVTTGR